MSTSNLSLDLKVSIPFARMKKLSAIHFKVDRHGRGALVEHAEDENMIEKSSGLSSGAYRSSERKPVF